MDRRATVQRVADRFAAEDADFWKNRAEHHEREIQAIKRKLKSQFGGVFDEYLGLGAAPANKLRKALELNRVSWTAAREQRHPTPAEVQDALKHLGKAVQEARV